MRFRSRRPQHQAGRYRGSVRQIVSRLRRKYPKWGAKKLRWLLRKSWPRRTWPCVRTLERWQPARQRIRRALPGPILPAQARHPVEAPNDLWTADFKGWFRTDDGQRVEPLTVRDAYSRYVLWAEHVCGSNFVALQQAFTVLFQRAGLPRAIRVDNGPPFGAVLGPRGLSRLTIWWLRLGIEPEFTRPGHPQDNGAHEQMHRVLKAETATPPAATARLQHKRFVAWRDRYNHERPHEALQMAVPAQLYRRSRRAFPAQLPDLVYPRGCLLRYVGNRGEIGWQGRPRFIGKPLAGQRVGLQPQLHCHHVFFGSHFLGLLYPYDLGGIRPVRRAKRGHEGEGASPPPLNPSPSF